MTKPLRTQAYWRRHRLQKCMCAGYHFPHRKTGGACEHGARADYYRAIASGCTQAEAQELLSSDQLERMFPLEK
jgi:hypothetical protein